MITGSIGSVAFSVSPSRIFTWKEFSQTSKARFVQHEIFNRKPLLEHTGSELDTFSLTLALNANLGIDPEAEHQKLVDIKESGEEQVCIIGGKVLGKYVIESIDRTTTRADGSGRPLVMEATVNLIEYVEYPDAHAYWGSDESMYAPGGIFGGPLDESELAMNVSDIKTDLAKSSLASTFMAGTSAAQSAIASARDCVNGVTAAIGAATSNHDFIRNAVDVVNFSSNVFYTADNISLAAMQDSLDIAAAAYPFGTTDQLVRAVKDVTSLTQNVQDLVELGPEYVAGSLYAAVDSASSISSLVRSLNA